MRVARPTDNLPAIADMYAKGLGFSVLVIVADEIIHARRRRRRQGQGSTAH